MPPSQLTAREIEIRDLAATGLTNEAIARRLGLSKRTVEAHLRMVYRKTGLTNRADLNAPHERLAPGRPPTGRPGTERLRQLERKLGAYEDVMKRLIDRQFPLYDEKIELTIKVGSTPQEDVVTEQHWTDPSPYLVYRVIRPITPFAIEADDPAESLAITCEVDRADVRASIQAVPDLRDRPRALVLFQPGLDGPAEWTIRYRTEGLWNELRRDGIDRLEWAAGTLDERYTHGVLRLQVNFKFPRGAEGVQVTERRGIGRVEQTGPTDIVYIDESRIGGFYQWEVRMRPTA